MAEEFPSQEEQDTAWEYCYKRPLYRPRISAWSITVKTLVLIAISLCLAFIVCRFTGISFVIALVSFIIAGVFLYAKKIVIGMIELYQHFAPEYIRRRCLLMPTCSEYMILAVKKYGAIRGVCKGINRLFTRCCGTVYRIDYP